MAKLPNIIEKDRSLWEVLRFVFIESLRGSKKYSRLCYWMAGVNAIFAFAEFGAVALIVNEFTVNGVAQARTEIIVYGLVLMGISHFAPEVVGMFIQYIRKTQYNELARHFQSLIFKKMDEIDIGTIEQPEFQNMFSFVNRRSWNSSFNMIASISDSITRLVALTISTIALISITPIGALVVFIGALPTYFIERKNALLSNSLQKEQAEMWRIWGIKISPLYHKDDLTELKNFKLVEIFRKKYIASVVFLDEKIRLINKKYFLSDSGSQVLLTATFIVVFGLLIRGVYQSTISIGLLVFSVAILTRFQASLNALFNIFGKMVEDKKTVSSFMDLLEMEPLVKSGSLDIHGEEFRTLEIKKVSFTYPGATRPVLNNMSLVINHTDSLAIVGLNGAGKTTLIKLLTRVYDPTKGKILVNGIDLKEYDLKAWKKCLGILLQEYNIYSEETIAENIMLGDTSKHDQLVVEAVAKETTADVFIQELPQKYQQRVGTEFQGGVELSKGQKQKLALSRVLYRNAPIIVLDEPTAAIDALSEDYIFKALRNNHKHQTRVIISHKFSNVRDADKIILIEHGKIIEQGNHDELMGIETGKYKELFNLQAEGYQDKPKRKTRTKKAGE